MTQHNIPTWYVLEPRNEPCAKVNPKLYQEFVRMTNGRMDESDPLLTEAFCVQWMDLNVFEGVESSNQLILQGENP